MSEVNLKKEKSRIYKRLDEVGSHITLLIKNISFLFGIVNCIEHNSSMLDLSALVS
jgi:hypothetical protein